MTRSEKLWCWTVNDARDDLFLLGSDTVPLSPVLVSLGSLHIQDFQMNSPLFVLDPSGRLWEYGLTKETLFKPLHEQSPTHPEWLQIPIPERVAQIGVGNFAACARTVSGDVWCWGEQNFHSGRVPSGDAIVPPTKHVLPHPAQWLQVAEAGACAGGDWGRQCWGYLDAIDKIDKLLP